MSETLKFTARIRSIFPIMKKQYISGFGDDAKFEDVGEGFCISFTDNYVIRLDHRPDWQPNQIIEFTAKVLE